MHCCCVAAAAVFGLLKDRSGEGAASTKFTSGDHVARGDGKAGYGRKGGSSWTEKWLKFDNRCDSLHSTACDGGFVF